MSVLYAETIMKAFGTLTLGYNGGFAKFKAL